METFFTLFIFLFVYLLKMQEHAQETNTANPSKNDAKYDKTQQTIDPDTQNKVDARATGKYIAIKFQNTTATTFELNGYDIEYEVAGER